jgi:hypothetical protein
MIISAEHLSAQADNYLAIQPLVGSSTRGLTGLSGAHRGTYTEKPYGGRVCLTARTWCMTIHQKLWACLSNCIVRHGQPESNIPAKIKDYRPLDCIVKTILLNNDSEEAIRNPSKSRSHSLLESPCPRDSSYESP